MIINPIYALLILYFLVNLLTTVLGIYNGGVIIENKFFILDVSSLFFSFLTQSFFLVLFYFLYKRFDIKSMNRKLEFKNKWGWALLFLQCSFLMFNMAMGVNVAGNTTRLNDTSLFNYIFVVFAPDIIFFIVSVSLISNRFFLLNVIVFLISMFLRGWMGGIFIVSFILLIRYYPLKISTRSLFFLIISILLLLCLSPVIIDAKWILRTGGSFADVSAAIKSSFEYSKYELAFYYILNRFQHVGHVALLYENSNSFYEYYSSGKFMSYWMDGLPQYILSKIFGWDNIKLNSYMVEFFFNIHDPSWNVNPGLAGWFFILHERVIFLIIYCFLVCVAPCFFIAKYAGRNLLMLTFCFMLVYFYHGWFGAYFNLILYCSLIIFIAKIRIRI